MANQTLSLFLEAPEKITQYKDPQNGYTCWAAGLASWLGVSPKSPANWLVKTQEDAIKNFGGATFANSYGILDGEKGLNWMTAAVGMVIKSFRPATGLTGSFLYSVLKQKGHIYFGYVGGAATPGQIAHCVVIYGITNPTSEECTISFMDPWIGDYTTNTRLKPFKTADIAGVGWLGHPEA